MAIDTQIKYTDIESLKLDPSNPRLGRGRAGKDLSQEELLEIMRNWSLEELATSFIESGYWPQEAVMVVEEQLYGNVELVVVEGNRRLAALIYLKRAMDGSPVSNKWADIVSSKPPHEDLFKKVPYLKADTREEIASFIGFRHVTGIKEWKPAEKAEYIAKLIENSGMDYVEVKQRIGSRTDVVRKHYIAYRLLLQMEESEDISTELVEGKFSVLYLSLRTKGTRQYLQIDTEADPESALHPVSEQNLNHLNNFALWLFGLKDRPPLFTDSRLIDKFGQILESQEAIEYLERSEKPQFEFALRIAGGDLPELLSLINSASDNIELALGSVHRHVESDDVKQAANRLATDAIQFIKNFPWIEEKIFGKSE